MIIMIWIDKDLYQFYDVKMISAVVFAYDMIKLPKTIIFLNLTAILNYAKTQWFWMVSFTTCPKNVNLVIVFFFN